MVHILSRTRSTRSTVVIYALSQAANNPSKPKDDIDVCAFSESSDGSVLVDSSISDIQAEVDAHMYTDPLIGLPTRIPVDGVKVEFGPDLEARRSAIAYCLSVGISPDSLPRNYAKVDKNRARRIAQLYDELHPSLRHAHAIRVRRHIL
ncbi:hypothetical protein MGYG_08429 [Nannizzia gypsea CBS 118893]|uniref:Uncharacterized protein n=1 Tax=Arthroderma gypseum (strain ATCC MYA-4604 / CBS 118893) TaxID=535722 RepID=E4V5P2_ARTGP|nr:hypothetical protein MGYG_08429 [Nannizzia gypsea CBS 118893]EFR05417.1 hypothetical protein MGYG_08429 [Nannizzia gypsea CBS 118893]